MSARPQSQPFYLLRRPGEESAPQSFFALAGPDAYDDGALPNGRPFGRLYFGGAAQPDGSIRLSLHCLAEYVRMTDGNDVFSTPAAVLGRRFRVHPSGSLPANVSFNVRRWCGSSDAIPVDEDDYSIIRGSGSLTFTLKPVWLADEVVHDLVALMARADEHKDARHRSGVIAANDVLRDIREICPKVVTVEAGTPGATQVPAAYVSCYQWFAGVFDRLHTGDCPSLDSRQRLFGMYCGMTRQLMRTGMLLRYRVSPGCVEEHG